MSDLSDTSMKSDAKILFCDETHSKKKRFFAKRPPEIIHEDHPTDWKTIYVLILLSILGMLQMSCINSLIWPYLQRLVPSSTQGMFAWMHSLNHLFNAITSVVAGYLSNHFAQTTGVLIFDKIIAIIACLAYFSIEIFTPIRVLLFFIMQSLFGIAGGSGSVAKTQIVMSSREPDLPKAMGLTQGAGTIGMILGPVLQIGIMKIGYPGIPLFFGVRLNLYTVPVFISITLAFIGLFLLCFCFDGKMRIRRKDVVLESEEEKELLENSPKKSNSSYDMVAVLMCICTNIMVGIAIAVLTTIIGPYTMMVFQWTSEDAVFWGAIGMLLVGFFIVTTLACYVCFKLGDRVLPRNGIMFSLFLMFMFFFLTYPWSFYGEKIPYKHPRGTDPSNFTLTNAHLNDTSLDLVGCPPEYKWCETTPPMNLIAYFAVSSLALGVAMPLFMINLNVLYSQVLGPIKQGTLQGIFNALGIVVQTVAPIGLSKVYEHSGVINIWRFIMFVLILCGISWVVFYKRMISYKSRMDQIEKQRSDS